MHVSDVDVQVGVFILNAIASYDVILCPENLVDSIDRLQLKATVLWELTLPWVVVSLGWVDGVI